MKKIIIGVAVLLIVGVAVIINQRSVRMQRAEARGLVQVTATGGNFIFPKPIPSPGLGPSHGIKP